MIIERMITLITSMIIITVISTNIVLTIKLTSFLHYEIESQTDKLTVTLNNSYIHTQTHSQTQQKHTNR